VLTYAVSVVSLTASANSVNFILFISMSLQISHLFYQKLLLRNDFNIHGLIIHTVHVTVAYTTQLSVLSDFTQ